MNPGYIYILQNPSFQNLLKVGKTNRSPKERARELSSVTGVPTEFLVLYDVFVPNCDVGEKKVHEKLKKYRTASNREFFELTLEVAKKIVNEIAGIQIEEEILHLEATLDKKVLQFRNGLENEISAKRKYFENLKPKITIAPTQPKKEEKQEYYEDLLIKAIKWGTEGVLKSLISKNIIIPQHDKYGKSIREIAKTNGNLQLLDKYIKISNYRDHRKT